MSGPITTDLLATSEIWDGFGGGGGVGGSGRGVPREAGKTKEGRA